MKVKTEDLIGISLDWAVATCKGATDFRYDTVATYWMTLNGKDIALQKGWAQSFTPSTDWRQGGPIIESANITVIRADDAYEKDDQSFTSLKRVPVWFAECDQWVGHSLCTSYEGEYMEPTFMIGEGGGYYGPTPLIAAMRCYVASKLGDEVEIPDALIR